MKAFPDLPDFAAVKAKYPLKRVGVGGARRACWKIGDTGFCVKFYKDEAMLEADGIKEKIRREVRRKRFDKERNISVLEVRVYEHYLRTMPKAVVESLPEAAELVCDPELGYGILETCYVNPDGTAVIPYEFEFRRQTPEMRELIYDQAKELLEVLIDKAAYFYEPGNFHVLLRPDGGFELKIVDFEPTSKMLFTLPWLPVWRRAILRRKARNYLASMRRKFSIVGGRTLKLLAEKNFGVKFTVFERIAKGNSSENFQAVAEDGRKYLVKSVRADRFEHVFKDHAADCPELIPGHAFGGANFAYGAMRVFAVDWVDGISIMPEKLTEANIAALLEAYGRLSAALRRSSPDGAPQIHGDLYADNVLFSRDGGKVLAFIDFEKRRAGRPTFDLVRFFVHRLERIGFFRFAARRRIRENLARAVALSEYPREEWLAAFDEYVERKNAHRLHRRSKFSAFFARLLRGGFYASLRKLIADADLRNFSLRKKS